MIKQLKYKNVLWLDVDRPSHEELESLEEKGLLQADALFNLEKPERKPKFLSYNDQAYLSLPSLDEELKPAEIKFWLKKDTLITIHYNNLPLLNDFAQILAGNLNSKKEKDFHSGQLFYLLLCKIYLTPESKLLINKDNLKQLEKNLRKTSNPEIVKSLTQTADLLAEIDIMLRGQRETLAEFGHWGKTFWGDKFARYQEAILDEYDHLTNLTQENRDLSQRLKEAGTLLSANRYQQGLKILSALLIAFLLFVLISIILNLV